MKSVQATKILNTQDKQNQYVFNKHELSKLFPDDNAKAFDEGLARLIKMGLLKRACRGIYVNTYARSFNSYVIEQIAKTLRHGHYNYVSLESMLSEYGLISQLPIDRLTVMTTGRSSVYKTSYGIIEFTHTQRSITNILKHTKVIAQRPLRIASKDTALRDLKRVGRNLDLILQEDINDE